VSISTIDERVLVPGLTVAEQDVLDALLKQLREKTPRNRVRAAYYDGKNAASDLGIGLPLSMRRVGAVLGWAAKAVDVLNRRCVLEGFTLPGVDLDGLGLTELWQANYLDLEAQQVGVSSLIHAVAFLITTTGDTAAGEPGVLVTAKDALSGTGDWNRRTRSLQSFLSVMAADDDGKPTDMVLYLPNLTVAMVKDGGRWSVDRRGHRFGVPVEPLPYQPRLGRPFGSSRISRPIMYLQDSAVRTVIRSETQAELYSAPARVVLGADEAAFKNADGTVKTAWQAIMGRLWALPDDEDAQNPRADVKEFQPPSQDPHVSQLRAWAQLFSGEASIPLASLGISADANPTSSEAYESGRDDLYREAEGAISTWTPGWRRTVLRGLQMLNGWDEIPAEVQALQPKWRDVRTPTRAAAADAAAKTLDKFPWLAETELGLELYGFDESFIRRAMAEKRRAAGRGVLNALRSQAERVTQGAVGE
jgi:hypothetical protein